MYQWPNQDNIFETLGSNQVINDIKLSFSTSQPGNALTGNKS